MAQENERINKQQETMHEDKTTHVLTRLATIKLKISYNPNKHEIS